MKPFIILLLALIIHSNVRAQSECGFSSSSMAGSPCSSCYDFNAYKNYTYNPQLTPIKNIRIVMHLFNRSDGTGSLPNSSGARSWLSGVVDNMNGILSNLQPMVPASSLSPNYVDARIRFVLDEIYFWDSDAGFNTGYTGSSGSVVGVGIDALYNTYVTNASNVTHKGTAIHIFMGGTTPANNGYAYFLGNYLNVSGAYQNYLNNTPQVFANIINHEIGHCLGLDHPFGGDGCDDTPQLTPYWCNGTPNCTTNMMDYNAQQWSLTQCQLNKIHYNLMANTAISNTLISSISTDNSIITGNDVICTTAKAFTIPNLQFGVTVSWSASPSSNVVMPNPCGAPILISTNTSGISSTTLSTTLCYGKYGSLSTPTKLLAINTLTGANTLICGNATGVITGGNIQSSPYPPCTTPFYTTNGQKTKLVANSSIELNQFEFGQGSDVEMVISSCP